MGDARATMSAPGTFSVRRGMKSSSMTVIFYSGVYLIENLRKPIGIALVADRLDRDVLATALSAESQAETIFAALIAPLIGFMADRWGVGQALMVVSGLLIVLMPLYSANVRTQKR